MAIKNTIDKIVENLKIVSNDIQDLACEIKKISVDPASAKFSSEDDAPSKMKIHEFSIYLYNCKIGIGRLMDRLSSFKKLRIYDKNGSIKIRCNVKDINFITALNKTLDAINRAIGLDFEDIYIEVF